MKRKLYALSLILFLYGALPAVPEDNREQAVTDAQLQAVADQHEPDPRWWVNALNTVQHFSSRRWLHQEDRSELLALGHGFVRRRDGQNYDLSLIHNFTNEGRYREAHNTSMRLKPLLRKDISSTKAGPIVEGIGELADIATLTAKNKWLVGGANLLALLTRSADVTLGSFPQFSFDADGYGRPVPRFWGAEWMEHPEHKHKMWGHFVSLLANQAGKFWDIFRAGNRIKNAKLIAWYNKNKLSKKKRWYLHAMQLIHAAVLLGSMVLKSKCAYANRHYPRYKYLIAEAVVSLIRRLHMRYLQSKMLNDARDEWAVEEELKKSS